MKSNDLNLRLAVTGAPGTGKSTVSEALAIVTGLPRTEAAPSHRRRHASGVPTLVENTLGAFERRVHEESRLEQFVADGSLIQEWALEQARFAQAQPTPHAMRHPVAWMRETPERLFVRGYLQAFERIVTRRAHESYGWLIHLPVDERFDVDGDLTPEWREEVDRLLIRAIHRLGRPYLVIGGTFEDVVHSATQLHGLEPRVSVSEAVRRARLRMAAARPQPDGSPQEDALI